MKIYQYFQSFYPIDTQYIDIFLAKCTKKSYKKGDIMTAEGQIQRDLLLIEEGIQMSYFNNDGKIHILAFTYPISISGIPDSFLLQKSSQFTLEALTNSTCLSIDFETLNQLFESYPPLERLFRKITEMMLIGMINRHVELHALSISQRFSNFVKRSPHLLQFIPHKYIANYLHIDPTNFSKLFNSIKIE